MEEGGGRLEERGRSLAEEGRRTNFIAKHTAAQWAKSSASLLRGRDRYGAGRRYGMSLGYTATIDPSSPHAQFSGAAYGLNNFARERTSRGLLTRLPSLMNQPLHRRKRLSSARTKGGGDVGRNDSDDIFMDAWDNNKNSPLNGSVEERREG